MTKCFDDEVISVATNGEGTIFLYENCNWAWTSDCPTQLTNKLKGRSRNLPKPVYVALGSKDRYYILFEDGKSQWVGPENLGDAIHKRRSRARSVAFGSEWNSYFVVFEDGHWQYGGDLPYGLTSFIQKHKKRINIKRVSLGSDDQWWIEYDGCDNSNQRWGGIDNKTRSRIGCKKNRMKFLDFGDDDTYILRYT